MTAVENGRFRQSPSKATWTDGLGRQDLAGRLLACIAFAEFGEALDALEDDGLRRRYAELCAGLADIRDRGVL